MLKKFNWGHGVVLALLSFIGFILFMVLIFPNGKQNSEMVSDSYYEEELHYQEVIDAKNNAAALAEQPAYKESANGISIVFPNVIQPDAKKVSFSLYRTDDKNLDVSKEVQVDEQNGFSIPKQVLVKGSYTLKVKWTEKSKPFQVDYDVLWK